MENLKFFWSLAYRVWPPCIRTAEILGFHGFRQNYLLGSLSKRFTKEEFEKYLIDKGFELTVIAWRDPGEVLSVRRIDREVFQHHIRLFDDGEIRAHYEYSPESRPYDHFWEARFDPETEFFKTLLGEYLVPTK
jgi:hypothetical protein